MTRFNNTVTHQIIRKIHLMLGNVKSGEEIIDHLRSTEPIFMEEVGRFVTIELDKLKSDLNNDEEFMMYVGSVLGAAYIMGFLIAKEMDHQVYDGLIDFKSLFKEKTLDPKHIDKIIDSNLEKGKKHKEIGTLLKKYISEKPKKPKAPKGRILKENSDKETKNKKHKKPKRINIDFNEGDL